MAPRGLSLVVLVAVACSGAPPAPPRTVRFESTVHSARLDNGMRVLVVEDHDSNLVELGIRLDVGSLADPPGKAGLAHLVEHILFEVEGTPDRRPLRAHLAAAAIGFNAYTSWEATMYWAVARADQLAGLLEVEALRFSSACPSVRQEAFEREREVVLNELRLHRSMLGELGSEALRILYPPDHPYSRSIGGTDASVSRLTLEDVCRFIDQHYQPDRMVVIATGDVEARAAIHAVARTLGRLAGRSRGGRPVLRHPGPARRRIEARPLLGEGPELLVEWPMPPSYAPDYPAAAVALSLVSHAFADGGPPGGGVREVGTGSARLAVAAVPLRGGSASDAAVDAALHEVDRAVERSTWRLRDETLERLANRNARQLLERFDDMSSRIDRMAEAFQLAGDDHVFVHHLARYHNVDRDAVRAAVERTFARDRRSLVVVVPPAARKTAPKAVAGRQPFAGTSHEADWQAPVDPREANRPLRVPLPRQRTRRAERFRLANGLTVVMLQTSTAPLISARLVFAGGSADDPPGKDGLAALAANLLRFPRRSPRRGASWTPEAALRHFADDFGVDVGRDVTVFGADGLSSHLDAVISGVASRVVDGEYRDADLAALRRYLGQKSASRLSPAVRAREEAAVRVRAALFRSLFGAGHPYARSARLPFRGGGALISRRDLESVREGRFGAANGVLVLCGQFDPALAREHIEHWFAGMRRGRSARVPRPPPRPTPAVIAEPTDPADPVTTVHIGFAAPAGGRRALRHLIGRIVGERMERLRQALGAAYTVQVDYPDDPEASALLISAQIDAARSGEALHLMMEEIARLRIGDADLAAVFVRARRQALLEIVAEGSGARQSADRIARLVARGEDLAAPSQLAREVGDLSMDDARLALGEVLAVSRQVIALSGPPESVAAARRAIDR